MTLPRKGARTVTVDRVVYRWTVRRRPTYGQGLGQSPLTVAVEQAGAPGSVLVVRLPGAHPGNWLGLPAAVATPASVALAVHEAREQGWRPGSPGGPFRLDLVQR
ncbi:hypothetical protein SAMN05216371_6509 [Streptomyces sp. TLI_053]|uniref:hypothetical protein n=1 Tax=Streptomyces sp. TLI_053 TaxID=1855352 RepID=UPI00087D4BF4|nr:hypothetical protein [Streptomyces sp. TLI_053]SDT81001.1 hypothetical protein SAMN05216371_6509 [Streptomyces sp. TLI_053]